MPPGAARRSQGIPPAGTGFPARESRFCRQLFRFGSPPRHPAVPGPIGLDTALHRERGRSGISASPRLPAGSTSLIPADSSPHGDSGAILELACRFARRPVESGTLTSCRCDDSEGVSRSEPPSSPRGAPRTSQRPISEAFTVCAGSAVSRRPGRSASGSRAGRPPRTGGCSGHCHLGGGSGIPGRRSFDGDVDTRQTTAKTEGGIRRSCLVVGRHPSGRHTPAGDTRRVGCHLGSRPRIGCGRDPRRADSSRTGYRRDPVYDLGNSERADRKPCPPRRSSGTRPCSGGDRCPGTPGGHRHHAFGRPPAPPARRAHEEPPTRADRLGARHTHDRPPGGFRGFGVAHGQHVARGGPLAAGTSRSGAATAEGSASTIPTGGVRSGSGGSHGRHPAGRPEP